MGRPIRIVPPPRRPAPPAGRRLVEVSRGAPAEAAVVTALLESHGIPTAVRSHLVTSVHPFTVGEQGQVAILVPESAAARSRALLRAARATARRRREARGERPV